MAKNSKTIAETAQPVAKLDMPFEARLNEEYQTKYGWLHKGDIDSTLKAILKELVSIRLLIRC